MKRYRTICNVISATLFFVFGALNAFGQACSSTPGSCTYTRSSVLNTSVTVNSGEVLCVTSGTYTGDVTLNAGATVFVYNTATFQPNNFNINGSATINVISGGTFNKDMSPNSAVVLNNCGTISGTRTFNPGTASNLIINQYSSNTITLLGKAQVNLYANNSTITYSDIDGGVNVAIKSGVTGVTINASAGNRNSPVTIIGETNSNSTIFSPASTLGSASFGTITTITAAAGSTMTFPNEVYMNSGSITSNGATLNFQTRLYMNNGTLNLGTNSLANINQLYKNGGNINVGCNSTTIVTTVNSFSGATPVTLTNPGCCSYFSLINPPSGSFNDNWLNSNGAVAPNGIYYCGVTPYNSAASTRNLVSISNVGGKIRITTNSGHNNPSEIFIRNVTGTDKDRLNGYWKVTVISSTELELTGSVYTTNLASNVSLATALVYIDQIRFGTGIYKGETCPSTSCTVLPVSLLYFEAKVESNNTILKWSSTSEKDNKLYVIQRSIDGISFTDLNGIEGAGYSTSTLLYNDIDYNTPQGVSYYRIKMIDSKGGVTFSSIESVNNRGDNMFDVYPNPNNGDFTITWGDSQNEDAILIAIVDVTGNVVRNYETTFDSNSISINSLPKGMYLVEINTNTTKVVKKVIVGL